MRLSPTKLKVQPYIYPQLQSKSLYLQPDFFEKTQQDILFATTPPLQSMYVLFNF